jgi:hypothetical protein
MVPWTFKTNAIKATGQIFTNGDLTGSLAFDGGWFSQIDDGALQPELGPCQNQAGYYAGTWKTGSKNGKMLGVLAALGQFTYCLLDQTSTPFDGGGPAWLAQPANRFDSVSLNGIDFTGVLTNTTRIIAGIMTNSEAGLHGSFQLNRAGFVPINPPPTIIAAPQNKTLFYGANATFAVTAVGAAPLSYQWYSAQSQVNDFVAITDATKSDIGGQQRAPGVRQIL